MARVWRGVRHLARELEGNTLSSQGTGGQHMIQPWNWRGARHTARNWRRARDMASDWGSSDHLIQSARALPG